MTDTPNAKNTSDARARAGWRNAFGLKDVAAAPAVDAVPAQGASGASGQDAAADTRSGWKAAFEKARDR